MPYTLARTATRHPLTPSMTPAWPYRLAAWLAARFRSRRDTVQPGTAGELLQRLLDRRPGTRKHFPHLALVEDCLRRDGLAGLRRLPARSRAHAREELLTIAAADESALLLALLASDPEPAHNRVRRASTQAIPDVEVTEINEELFYEALREWEGPGLPTVLRGAGAPDVNATRD